MAKELIQKLLRIDPKERLTAEELLKDPWIVGHDTPRKNLPATLDSIKKYKQYKIKVNIVTNLRKQELRYSPSIRS